MAYMKDATGRRLDGFKAISADEAARSGFPAHAPAGLAGRFDPRLSVYNWKASNTRKLRAAVNRAQAGGFGNLLFVGDSRTDNYMGSVDNYDRRKMWPSVCRAELQQLLPDLPAITDGLIKIGWAGQIDPRVVTSGTWSNNGDILFSTSNGASITITTSLPCTNIDLNLTGGSGAWTYAIDGGAATSVTVSTSFRHVSITGLAATTHTIVLTNTSTATASIHSVVCWNASGGLTNHNVSIFGSKIDPSSASGWGTPSTSSFTRRWYVEQAMAGANLPGFGVPSSPPAGVIPDCLFVQLGVNDWDRVGWIASNIAGLTTLRGRWPSSDFVLFVDQQPGPSAGNEWPAWSSALYSLAETLDVPVVDLYSRCGDHTTTFQNGLIASDRLHSPYRWQKEQGRVLAQLIAG